MSTPGSNETVYQTRTLSKWFALGSLFLLVVVIWAAIQDYARPWKDYQRQYKRIASAVGERKLLQAQKAMDSSKLQALETKIKEIKQQQSVLTKEIDSKIELLEGRYYILNKRYQVAKGEVDAFQYTLEVAIEHKSDKTAELQKSFAERRAKVEKLRIAAEVADNNRIHARDEKKDILSAATTLQDQLTASTRERDMIVKGLQATEASIVNLLRNSPVVDFVSPTIKVNQVILNGIYDDYFFTKVPRVDRCMSCHVTADKPGFEDYPQPFKTHPKLNLMVGPDSPHPAEKIGCTVCHSGVPQAIDFTKAAHAPRSMAQRNEWEDKYGFEQAHDIKTHMIPLPMVEGKCIQCHAKQVNFADAPTLDAGMRLIERYGCYNCHKFAGHFEQLAKERKSGPTLKMIASKVNQDWVRKWLWEPKSFRPSTLMPAFWQLHNNSDPKSLERGKVEVDAIAHVLFAKAKPYEPLKKASTAVGDATKGKELVGQLGCLACHAVEDFPRKNPTDPTMLGYKDPRVPMFGPELNQLGSKVSDAWLYSWLMNPKHYWEGAMMPSMKLKPEEAIHISAYLLSKRNARFDSLPVPQPKENVRDAVVSEYLKAQMAAHEADVKLASMSLADKQQFLGEKLINHYGCYACHAIEGFEASPNIGAELTYEGSKEVTKFDFGNVHINHVAREEWLYTKIRTPRIWDVGKRRDFQAKTRMPQFPLTHEQANAIATVVIGYENNKVSDEFKFRVDGRMEQVIAGERVINRQNCIGCHAIEKRNAHILAHYADPSEGPPNLNTEGRKAQPNWLFSYLKNTDVMIRPWVKVRMPQFGMSDEMALALTKYFAAYDKAIYPFRSHQSNSLTSQEVAQVESLINKQGCMTCHAVRKPGEDVAAAAPHFSNVKARLNGDWVAEWISNPPAIMPGTRMPVLWPAENEEDPHSKRIPVSGYFGDDAELQIQKVRDYLFQYPGSPELPPAPEEPKAPLAAEKPANSATSTR